MMMMAVTLLVNVMTVTEICEGAATDENVQYDQTTVFFNHDDLEVVLKMKM